MQFSVNYTVVFFIFQAKIHLYKNIFDKNPRFSLDKSQFLAYYIFIRKPRGTKLFAMLPQREPHLLRAACSIVFVTTLSMAHAGNGVSVLPVIAGKS